MTSSFTLDLILNDKRWEHVLPDRAQIAQNVTDRVYHETIVIPSAKPSRDRHWEISLLLTNDNEIRKLNKRYRKKNTPTNVLSFPACCAPLSVSGVDTPLILGDIIIALETLVCESAANGIPLEDHFSHLFAHGLLHLLGFNHAQETEALAMERLEGKILADMGIKNPYERSHI